jgi:hypothetical protein
MSFWAAGTSLAVGIGGSLISANSASKAAKAAQEANLQQAKDTNALNERLFNQSRGAVDSTGYGHAILPVYFGGNEQALGQSAYDIFNKLQGAGSSSYGQLQGLRDSLTPALSNSLNALSNRFNGQDLQQRLAYADPYFQARARTAQIQGQGLENIAGAGQGAINIGLQRAIAQMNAQRAGQGYFGSSTFDRNRLAQSTIGAQQQGAIGLAQAHAQAQLLAAQAAQANAQDTAGIQHANLDFMSNPGALGAGLSAAGGFFNAPAQALANSYSTAMTPLNYFRIAPQAFQQQNLPQQSPEITNGQIYGSTLGQIGQTGANYFLTKNLLSSLGNSANPYASGGAVYSPSVLGQTNFLQGASPFASPYAAQGASLPTFDYKFPPTG